MPKTRKSLAKRFKITSTGKILRRVGGKNHFNAKKRRATQLRGASSRLYEGRNSQKVRAGLAGS